MMDAKVKAANVLLEMMEVVYKLEPTIGKNDSYNEKEREVDRFFRYIFQELNHTIVSGTARECISLQLEGNINNYGNLVISSGFTRASHVIRNVEGVEFSSIIKETLDIFENINGFMTIHYGTDDHGHFIIFDVSVKGRN